MDRCRIKLVVGLGNPGKEYAFTKHNVGWMVVDTFARENKVVFKKVAEFKGYLATLDTGKGKVFLLKPLTFMNRSGESVKAVCDAYEFDPCQVLVVLDDLDLRIGKLRLRLKGGSAGHRGLISIMDHLGTDQIPRLRIGIGKPERREEVVNYVLSPFDTNTYKTIKKAIVFACDCLAQIVTDGSITDRIFSRCNREVDDGI